MAIRYIEKTETEAIAAGVAAFRREVYDLCRAREELHITVTRHHDNVTHRDGCDVTRDGLPKTAAERARMGEGIGQRRSFRADCIIAGGTFGGTMVEATIKAADQNVPVRLVTASRGKAVRAEPVSVRYEQAQIRHAGRFPKLEDQLCAFSAAGYPGADSPDHADAAIWAFTHSLGIADGTAIIEFYRREGEQANQRPGGFGPSPF